nr:MAG TPA: hypothetical protein [Caudoviricetes sp.]
MWYNYLNKSSRPLEEAQEGGYLKGHGLCRERHCLWAVPLLILQKIPCFAEALRATRGAL